MGTVCSVIPASHYESDGADTLAFGIRLSLPDSRDARLLRAAARKTLRTRSTTRQLIRCILPMRSTGNNIRRMLARFTASWKPSPKKRRRNSQRLPKARLLRLFRERIGQILTALLEIEYCEDLSSIGKLLTLWKSRRQTN